MIVDILEKWYKNALEISSPINIKPKVIRTDVDYIYKIFREYFPKKFFLINQANQYDVEKESWIYTLISHENNIICIDELYDIARLIEYSKSLGTNIQTYMKSLIKNPRNLRDFFFELYIYELFDRKGVSNLKKINSGNQELEGILNHNQNNYLFECRKAYYPNLGELSISSLISTYFHRGAAKYINKQIGFIATVYLKGNKSGKLKDVYSKRISNFFREYNKRDDFGKIDYHVEDEFGELHIINYSLDNVIEIKSKDTHNVFFYFDGNKYQVEVNFKVDVNLIYEKFERILKEKKKQHENSEYQNKILFIDSESLPEFNMGLFQNESSYDRDRLKKIYEAYCKDWIVCIIRRDSLQTIPKLIIDFFHQENHKEMVGYLYAIFKNN